MQKLSEIAKIWVLTEKCTIITVFTFFRSFFQQKNVGFLALFVCAEVLNRNIGRAKKNTFRKSAHNIWPNRPIYNSRLYMSVTYQPFDNFFLLIVCSQNIEAFISVQFQPISNCLGYTLRS